MLRRSLTILVLVGVGVSTFGCAADVRPADTVIALERAALDRWGRGDPEGYGGFTPATSPTSIRCATGVSTAVTR